MAFDLVDLVWSAMRDDEFYSPIDLANILGQTVESVARVLEFLKKYKFAEQVTSHEMIFRRITDNPCPRDALGVLQMVLSDVRVERAERVNLSQVRRRFNPPI
jgi:hypothetical protein